MSANKVDIKKISQLANAGIRLTEAGLPDKAIEKFQQALSIKQDEGNIRYGLGLTFMNKGDPESALREFKLAMRFEPMYPDTYFAMATIYRLTGPAWRSDYFYLAYLDLVTSGEKARVSRSRLNEHVAGTDKFEAASWLEIVHRHYEAYINGGFVTQALEQARENIELRPVLEDAKIRPRLQNYFQAVAPARAERDASYHFEAGDNLMNDKKFRASVVQFMRGIELFPQDQLALACLAKAFLCAGDEIALELFRLIDIDKADTPTQHRIYQLLRPFMD